jgi:rod shape-determining protein MreD
VRRRTGFFGTTVFLAGWVFYALFSYFWNLPLPAPQWLFLAVLAVGARGKVNTAQTLGFFWGLLMDVQSGSLFGAQGWIFAVAGFAAGKYSRQVDGDKPSAQVLLALGGTLFHQLALSQIEVFFRRPGPPHTPAVGMAFLQLFLNVAAAPLVFGAVGLWNRLIPSIEGDHVFRS